MVTSESNPNKEESSSFYYAKFRMEYGVFFIELTYVITFFKIIDYLPICHSYHLCAMNWLSNPLYHFGRMSER